MEKPPIEDDVFHDLPHGLWYHLHSISLYINISDCLSQHEIFTADGWNFESLELSTYYYIYAMIVTPLGYQQFWTVPRRPV